jgi:hypothetical protein
MSSEKSIAWFKMDVFLVQMTGANAYKNVHDIASMIAWAIPRRLQMLTIVSNHNHVTRKQVNIYITETSAEQTP